MRCCSRSTLLPVHDDEPVDIELRRARTVISLAIALQGAMADYQHDELERLYIMNRSEL